MPMEIARLIEPAADWPQQTWASRIDQAASLLFMHGYISGYQRKKVAAMLNSQFTEAVAAGEIKERRVYERRAAANGR